MDRRHFTFTITIGLNAETVALIRQFAPQPLDLKPLETATESGNVAAGRMGKAITENQPQT